MLTHTVFFRFRNKKQLNSIYLVINRKKIDKLNKICVKNFRLNTCVFLLDKNTKSKTHIYLII